MSFLKRLFLGSDVPKVVTQGHLSIMKAMLGFDYRLETANCSLCGTTSPITSQPFALFTTRIEEYKIDVGGYCHVCQGHRCPGHTMFVEVFEALYDFVRSRSEENKKRLVEELKSSSRITGHHLGCRKCGTPFGMSLEQVEAWAQVIESLNRIGK